MFLFRLGRGLALGGLTLALLATSAQAAADAFAVPRGMAGQVEFWKLIFTTYDENQVLIHDTKKPDRVYSILDFRSLTRSGLSDAAVRAEMNRAEDREKKRIRALLERLHRLRGDRDKLSVEELRIRSLFADDARSDRFQLAATEDRVRGQRGIRSRFLEGVQRGHRYLPRMERIFRAEGVPVEVTRLPLVESSFNTNAYSKVGAAGMWQFMPGTARHFMTISPAIDERLDPFVATRAAARYLRQNYDRLGTWPLAISAYNHGPGGLARAVSELGTKDIATIVDRYEGKAFGFASRNFYAEFLAALEVERNHEDYFGPIRLDPPMLHDEVPLRNHVAMASVLRCSTSDVQTIKALNPALRPAAFFGQRSVPAGYRLRLPQGAGGGFDACYASLPKATKRSNPPALATAGTHRVRRGETLASIARRHGVSVDSVRRQNGIRDRNVIRVGQVLKIPGARSTAPRQEKRVVHRVKKGQTLHGIARSYGNSVEQLRRYNKVGDRNTIRVGQLLTIPPR